MTVVTPDRMLVELEDDAACGPRHTHWISEPGGLTQFGAFVQVLLCVSRSSIKHWHSAEDELNYVLVWCLSTADQQFGWVRRRQLRDKHHTKPLFC